MSTFITAFRGRLFVVVVGAWRRMGGDGADGRVDFVLMARAKALLTLSVFAVYPNHWYNFAHGSDIR
jgi:hypothetical protein